MITKPCYLCINAKLIELDEKFVFLCKLNNLYYGVFNNCCIDKGFKIHPSISSDILEVLSSFRE